MDDLNTTVDEGRRARANSTLVQRNGRIGFVYSADEFSGRTNFSVKMHGVVRRSDGCLVGVVFQVDRSDATNESR